MFDGVFPTEKIKELVALIKAGELTDNIPASAKLALWIVGSTIETFYPDLQEAVFGQSVDQETVESLAQAVVSEAPDEFPQEGEMSANAISPLLLIAIARLAAKLLEGSK